MRAPFFELGAFGPGGALAFALLIGIAFGWFLERAGLGNARKLAAQFYGTDWTVFKVMFSAVLTAMLGAFWLSRLGWMDLSLVYLPGTWWLPQLAGGVIFGVGFAIGGLCPGTSCVAASSGRIDGIVLVLGMLVGVFAFHEAFPRIAGFYDSTPAGALTLADWSGLPYGVVVGAITLVAIAGFRGAEWVEKRLSGSSGDES